MIGFRKQNMSEEEAKIEADKVFDSVDTKLDFFKLNFQWKWLN
jgi:hypothetical protein